MRILSLAALMLTPLLVGCNQSDAKEVKPVKATPIYSLRGDVALKATPDPAPFATYPSKGHTLPRAFQNQPPLMPHNLYPITAKRNSCQSCHGRKAKADVPVTHPSHHLDDGSLNPAYNFCTQCHVPQADNRSPIVANDFVAPGYPD